MSSVRGAAPRTKLRQAFDLNRRRRIVIERHAIHVGAAETEDLSRWLVAWIWHNPNAKDQVGAVIECARRVGRTDMSPAAAREIIDEAQSTPKCRKAVAERAGGTGKPASCSRSAVESSVREQLSLGNPAVGEVEHEPTDLVPAPKPATNR